MLRQRNMIAALVLLCVFELPLSCGAAAKRSSPCVPSHEVKAARICRQVACFVPADYTNASGPVSIEVCVGKKLTVSLEHVSEYPLCHWIRGADPVLTVNESHSMILPPLSETDSGDYMLRCDSSSGTESSMSVSLHVVKKQPKKPKLTLDRVEDRGKSPSFTCISEGCPKPTLEWSGNKKGNDGLVQNGEASSIISSIHYSADEVMCCATNAEGQECSQLYDYDLENDSMMNNEVSNVTVSPGDSLLLRCRMRGFLPPLPVWEKGSKIVDASRSACPSKTKEEICVRNDDHLQSQMTYLFIKYVSVHHSGTYTCRGKRNRIKSVYIHVQAKGFLSVQLDESKIIPAQNASTSCLQASVSYHPVLQHCSWEAPDKTLTKCIREAWVTKHRTVKLCQTLKSGDYRLHLEAGEQKETKTISVCVVDKPKFRFRIDDVNSTYIFETESLVPANFTWLSCSSSNNDSGCETDSSWTEITDASETDSDVRCHKTLKSSLSRDQLDGQHLRFCLTNPVGTWCQTKFSIYRQPSLLATRGTSNNDSSSMMALKVGSLVLFLALAVVSVVLVYFIKKRKPQYQPQLQMIQVVGPNDNDYIYINFKDFEYDSKWEFPRENLELGKELGSGAFGMVVQATAYGISKPGVSHQVAVKMLKEKHQTVEKEALMSELKMLTQISHHANIVNLLGACTKSGPTYLIFQYCCYGDLLNYLKKNRERYHKSVTDAFNKDRFSSLYHNLQPRKNSRREQGEPAHAVENYVPMHCSTSRGQEDITLHTLNSGDMDIFEDPENYENLDDETDNLQALTFDDLLSFAFQVAKGMEFLSSKNVRDEPLHSGTSIFKSLRSCIHRDLAARNVLMTKGRLVKIGDFGLARDIENDSNYVVRGNVRLPVKWMAPESTFQGIYTMKSDVWAFGILLWEIFSLGVTPYPGMKVDHKFYSMIERGFKMECPYYANESIYGIMCKCWALDPCNRPSFSKLVSFMCDQLTDREEMLYHNMPDQTPSDYQNALALLNISDSTKQNESKSRPANNYCQSHATEESRVEKSDSDMLEEKLLQSSDRQ